MSAAIEKLLERAVLMLERLERVLPQPLSQPDWNEAIAWRYRKRASGHGVLEGVRHVSDMSLNDLQEIDGQKELLTCKDCELNYEIIDSKDLTDEFIELLNKSAIKDRLAATNAAGI